PQAERLVPDELLPARRGGEQLRVVERDREKTPRRDQARADNAKPLCQGWLDAGIDPRTHEREAVHQSGVPSLPRQGQLATPGDPQEENRTCGLVFPHVLEDLRDATKHRAKPGCVAALALIHPGASPVEEEYLVTVLAQPPTGMLVPPAVTSNAVDGDHVG